MAAAQEVIKQMLTGISQQNRLIKLDTPLGPDVLLPQRVVANARLGRTYDYTVDLLSLRDNLELKQLIAQPVTLWVQQTNRNYLPVHGYVHTIKKLGSDGQFAAYQLSFAPWLHFLKFRQDARIWQDKTAEDILVEVFKAHPQAQGNFRFELSQPVKARSYCTQYESDWQFVMRIMEDEGWYGYHEQNEDGAGHVLVITDTVHKLKPLPTEQLRYHRAGSSDEVDKIVQWGGSRNLSSSRLATKTFDYKVPRNNKEANTQVLPAHGDLPAQLEVYEYTGAYTYPEQRDGDRQAKFRVEQWESQAKRFYGMAGVRHLPVGYWFTLADHPEHAKDRVEDRQFAVIAVDWAIENNLPLSTKLRDFPGSLKSQLDAFKGHLSIDAEADSSRTGHCFTRFEVQRRTVEFRSPQEHAKPVMHPQTATVVGPQNEEIFTDHLNRVKVKFHWDRLNPGDEKASCWVRVSYPNAGQDWGAVHVPRIGQEVIVTFLDADVDRPVITGRIYNGEQTPQWHTDGKLSGYKSKEVKGAGFNQLVMDDNTSQNRVQLYSSNTNAQLNLGYLVGQQGNTRSAFYGSGFSLKSDDYGAIVTNRGLYISTFGRPGALGSQLDVREAHQQLQAGSALTKALSDTAANAGAEALAGQDALKQFTDATQHKYDGEGKQQANRFKKPVLLVASPAGIGLTTPQSTHIHSGDHFTLSSGADTNLAVGKNLVASVDGKISMFAHNDGIQQVAAKGKVTVQSQTDDMELLAKKVLELISTTDWINIKAKKGVRINGGGSEFVISGDGIKGYTPGGHEVHAADHQTFPPQARPLQFAGELPDHDICIPCLLKAAKANNPFAHS